MLAGGRLGDYARLGLFFDGEERVRDVAGHGAREEQAHVPEAVADDMKAHDPPKPMPRLEAL